LFDKNNIADYTTEKIQEYNKKAEEHFERIHIAEKRKQPLLEVAQMLMYRNR
jgi:geranylgeranyl pyrophosphate synthase